MMATAYVCMVGGAFVALAAIFGGIGLLVRRAFGLRVGQAEDVAFSVWVGWAAGLVALQVWHLFLPADGRALAFLSIPGLAGLAWNWRSLAGLARQGDRRFWCLPPLLLLAALWISNQTATQAWHVDAGIYHLMNVRWAHDYPIVPGLGNLRNLLAYNQSYFLYVSMLDAGPFAHRSHHLAAGLVLYFLGTRAILSGWRIAVQGVRIEAFHVFDVLLLVPVIVWAMGVNGPSPTPDVGASALSLVMASQLLRLLGEQESIRGLLPVSTDGYFKCAGERGALPSPAEQRFAVVMLCVLAAVGVTVKFSTLAFASATVLLTILAVSTSSLGGQILSPKTWCWMVAAGLFIGFLWMGRSVLTSGYPLYPSMAFGFPVEWRVPEESVKNNLLWIYTWGRWYGADAPPERIFTDWSWVWPWLNRVLRQKFMIFMPLVLAAGVAPFLMCFCRAPEERRRQPRFGWLFLSVPALSLLYWFLTFPDPRHGEGALLSLGIGSIALALRRTERTKALAVVAALTVTQFALYVDPFEFLHKWHRDIGPAKAGKVEPVTTESGLTVYVPKAGEDPWDAPLPCTTSRLFVDPRLRLRVPGDLSKGFAIDAQGPSCRR